MAEGLLPVTGPDEGDTPELTADDLTTFEQESYELSGHLAVKLGFGPSSGTNQDKVHMLLWGVTKYKDVKAGNTTRRYGVAVRCLLFIESTDSTVDLSLTAVAAKVELGMAKASSRLTVNGYNGDISDPMPSWQSFNVDTYAKYVESVSALAKQIFHDADHIKPVLLNKTVTYEPSHVSVGWKLPKWLIELAI